MAFSIDGGGWMSARTTTSWSHERSTPQTSLARVEADGGVDDPLLHDDRRRELLADHVGDRRHVERVDKVGGGDRADQAMGREPDHHHRPL